MKTDEWIGVLAASANEDLQPRVEPRVVRAAVVGLAGAAVLMLTFFGVRPDLAQTLALPMFWAKLAFAAALAVPCLWAVMRLARPGARALPAVGWIAMPVAVIWALGGWELWQQPAALRMPMVLGTTWRTCPFNIALLAVPALLAGLCALRGGAPTHPGWAGAGAGLLAGALAALVYALHCPEMAAPFLAVWYVVGIAIPAALGALLGERWLRW